MFVRQDVVEVDGHQILVRRRCWCTAAIGRIRRDVIGQVACSGLKGRISIVRRKFQRAAGIGERRSGRQRNVRRLQFACEVERKCGLFVDHHSAVLVVLQKRRPGLADRSGLQPGLLRGLEQRTDQDQVFVLVCIELFQDAVVLGEDRFVQIDFVSARRARRSAGAVDRVAEEARLAGERAGRERGRIHHRESRIARMIVGEVGAALDQRRKVRRVAFADRVGAHAIPDEHDDAVRRLGAALFRRGRMGRHLRAAARDQGKHRGRDCVAEHHPLCRHYVSDPV